MLLDLTAQPFTHGHAYVAVSRIYEPGAAAVYVDETCCVDGADGRRRGVIANVTYPRFLRPLREADRVAQGPPRPPRGGGAARALALTEEAQRFHSTEGAARTARSTPQLAPITMASATRICRGGSLSSSSLRPCCYRRVLGARTPPRRAFASPRCC